jgi:hypothetical protein
VTWLVYRDARTGEYVTKAYALAHPDTTVSETVDPDATPGPLLKDYATEVVDEHGGPENIEPEAG